MKQLKFQILILLALIAPVACTSHFEEGSPAPNSSPPTSSLQERQEVRKKIAQQFDRLEQQIQKYKALFGVIHSVFGDQSQVNVLQILESIQEDAKQILPSARANQKYVVQGQIWVPGLGETSACHVLEYRLTSDETLLQYELKSCYSNGQFLQVLEIKSQPQIIVNIDREKLAVLLPLPKLVEAVKGCSIQDFDGESRLNCDQVKVTEDQDTITRADVREVPDAYLITFEVVNKETGKIEKSGFLNYEKSGRIGDLIWN